MSLARLAAVHLDAQSLGRVPALPGRSESPPNGSGAHPASAAQRCAASIYLILGIPSCDLKLFWRDRLLRALAMQNLRSWTLQFLPSIFLSSAVPPYTIFLYIQKDLTKFAPWFIIIFVILEVCPYSIPFSSLARLQSEFAQPSHARAEPAPNTVEGMAT